MEYCRSGFGTGWKMESFEMHAKEAKITIKVLLKVFLVKPQKEKTSFIKKASIFIKHLNNHE